MRDAPFVEQPVPADTIDPQAIAAKKSLQAELERLNPQGGKVAPTTNQNKAARKAKRKAKMQ